MKDKYVLDSSLWIEIHRENISILSKIEPLFQKNKVCLIDVISAEVLRGARNDKDYKKLEEIFNDFLILSCDWKKVAKLAYQVGKKGFNPPLIDLYIAQCVHENKKRLMTQDKHFLQISKILPFELEMIASS
ncbi:MAG: PIN domain-containing protein [Deltaproteobacteria bacterium]|nr:PIN domain-containing protein [Deltaproteobacteria bacterium]